MFIIARYFPQKMTSNMDLHALSLSLCLFEGAISVFIPHKIISDEFIRPKPLDNVWMATVRGPSPPFCDVVRRHSVSPRRSYHSPSLFYTKWFPAPFIHCFSSWHIFADCLLETKMCTIFVCFFGVRFQGTNTVYILSVLVVSGMAIPLISRPFGCDEKS